MLAGFPWLQVEKNKAMAEKKPPRLVSLNRLDSQNWMDFPSRRGPRMTKAVFVEPLNG